MKKTPNTLNGLSATELEKKLLEIFKDGNSDFSEINIKISFSDYALIEIYRMYEHINMSFKRMVALSNLFGTEEFHINQGHWSGCETCDFGSRYYHGISVPYTDKDR